MKDLYEASQKHEKSISENGARMDGFERKLKTIEELVTDVGLGMKNITQNIEYLMKKTMDQESGPPGNNRDKGQMDESGSSEGRSNVYTPPHMRAQFYNQNTTHNLQNNNHTVRLKFPEFNGEGPQNWIRKANRFFQIIPMEERAKVHHAGYYMIDVADTWFMEYVEGKDGIDWQEFCRMILQRFLCPGSEDVVIEFTKLTQSQDVNSYQERFDELKSLVRVKNPNLSEEFLTSCFLRGLKEELRVPVQLFKPTELTQAINTAKMLESTLDIWSKKNKITSKPSYLSYNKYTGNSNQQKKATENNQQHKEPKEEVTNSNLPFKRISDSQYQKRRALGLCFHCDEKYSYGHVCKKKQFNLILVEEEDELNEGNGEIDEELEENHGEISVNALLGNKSKSTLKVIGNVGKRKLNILIDSGSTNSFLDLTTVNELNCMVEETTPWIITVADGGKTTSKFKCTNFKWQMQGVPFETDLRVIKLGGCDMILGADWMWEHNPITFDLKKDSITVIKGRKRVVL